MLNLKSIVTVLLIVGFLSSCSTRSRVQRDLGGSKLLAWPIDKPRIVSKFGPRGRSFHDGIDMAAPSGTPVYSAHDGVVRYSGWGYGGYGRLLVIDNGSLSTVYAHNKRLHVRRGQVVRRGELIAEVGSSGRSSGPHLHFELQTIDSRGRLVSVDPLPILENSRRKPRYRVNETFSAILAKR